MPELAKTRATAVMDAVHLGRITLANGVSALPTVARTASVAMTTPGRSAPRCGSMPSTRT